MMHPLGNVSPRTPHPSQGFLDPVLLVRAHALQLMATYVTEEKIFGRHPVVEQPLYTVVCGLVTTVKLPPKTRGLTGPCCVDV